jgi:hypothetical protein
MLCGQCDVTVKGKIYCNPCVEQMFGEQPAVVPAEVVEEAVSAEVEAVAATAETEAVETAAPPKAPGKKRTGVWVGLGVGLAFVFIVVPLLLLVIGALSDSDGNGKAKVIPGPGPEITIGRTGAITTGPMVEVANKAISTSGGIVTVDKPGDPLNGFQIEVPPGAYKEAKTFKISSAPIQNQTFGPDFNPISPLITIESGGEYSEEPMLVKIPVDVPEGYSAMAFFYNKETGTLEGMTTLGQERNCLITATTHFSQLVVEKVPHNILNEDVSSGFSPLTDCLGFPNYGSSITPGGNCAGHTITAIWYYRHMRSRAEYGSACRRFDKNGRKPETTHFPYDDSLGWRLVSTLQKDILLRWYSKTFQEDSRIHHQRTTGGSPDKETAMRFANAIRKTERPQMVHIISTSSTQDGSHAMVVYRVDKGTLYVYDPNYPGDTDRKIEFSEGKFKPYDSAARVGAPGNMIWLSIATRLIWSPMSR